MSKLYFKVASDWQEVVRLRTEISKLEAQIKSMDANKAPQAVAVLNNQMQQAKQQMQGMVTEAAKAGTVMEYDFKTKIYQGSQSVNDFTQKIINQKAVVKDVEADVKRLGESYRSALKNNPLSASGKLDEYTSAKKALDEEKAALFGLTQEQANARLSVKKLRDEYSLYKDDGKGVVGTTDNIGVSLKKAFVVIGGVAAINQLGSNIIRVRGEFQAADTAIQTLLGSKEKADTLMGKVKEYAKVSPLEFSDVTQATQMMLGFNIEAERVPQYLRAIGDISMGETGKFNSLTLAFSQMSATGKLMGQDLNQMINAGFNPLQQIADTTGKSIAILKDEMSKGAISAEMVQQAFMDATSAGGKFFGMSENASKTINGQLSMMQDALDEVFNEIGTKGESAIMSGIQATTSLIQNYETVGKILSGLVITYGVYRTAVMLSTIATGKHTIAEVALTNVRVIARRAQMALNASMLTNPYVLLATVVVGAAAAMWAFHDGTTAAEKAQDSYNKKVEDAAQKAQDHKQKLEGLISELQNEVTAETRKMEILDEIKKGYPSLFQKFIDEKGHIKDLTEGWKAYNEEASKNKAIQNKDNVNGLKESIAEQRRFLELFDMGINDRQKSISSSPVDKTIWNKYNSKGTLNIKKDIETGERELWKWEKEVRDDEFTQWKVDLKGKTDEQIKAIRESMVSRSKSAKGDKNLLSALGKRIIALDEEKNSRKASSVTYGTDFKAAKTEWETAKKELDAIEKNKDKYTRTQYDNAKKREETAEKAYKDLGGVTNNAKQESAADKLRKEQEKYNLLLDQQKREEERMKTDSLHELEQIEINGLAEGSEKVLGQRKLNHEKELEAIKREAEDKKSKAIEEARSAFEANPDNKKGTFDADKFVKSEPAQKQFAIFDKTAESKTKTENTKYNRGDDFKGLLNEYQDYTDKRLAIETKYNNDLAVLDEQRKQAVKNGDTQQVEQIDRAKAQATKNKGKELMGMDYDKLKESPEYVRAFENLKETSNETLNSLLTQLENAKGAAAKVLSPDQLREYTTTIQEIMDELDARNPFQALADKKKELAEAENELAIAKKNLDKVNSGEKVVSGTKLNEKTGKIDDIYLTSEQALSNYNKAKDKEAKADAKVKKSKKEVRAEIDELCQSIDELGKSIGGPAGEIVSLIGDIGSFTLMAMSGIEAAADTSATAISNVEKASVILMIISAAIQIATKMLDMFGGDDTTEKYEKTKETYESYINILDQVIDKQLEMAESLSGASAQAAYDKAIELVKAQSEAARVLGKQYLNSGASWKSHSKGYEEFDDMSLEGWADGAKALGMTVDNFKNKMGDRMDGLFNLTDEQLAKLQGEAYIFWAQLNDDTQDYANQIAEGVSQIAEVLEQQIADTTLLDVDTLRSDFHDLLTDMDSNSADFADNFEEYMKNAILNSMLKEQYMGRLEEWRKKFYAAMDNGMTDEEYEDLKEEGTQISDDMRADREKMAEMYGWTGNESSSQDSSKGMSQSMSQDTGNELNGRFTALQIAGEEIKNQNILQSQSLSILTMKSDVILTVNTEIKNIADETRTILANSYLELQDIRENTGMSAKYLKDIKVDIAEVKNNTKGLSLR